MTNRIGFDVAAMALAALLAGIFPAYGEETGPPSDIERFIAAEEMAEAGEAQNDSQMMVKAACMRDSAGDVASVDIDRAPDRILAEGEDDLSVDHFLARAIAIAPSQERRALEVARGERANGNPLPPALCGSREDGLRGTGYFVRLTYHAVQRQTRTIRLPRLKPDEPVIITVRADSFGLVSFKLIGPDGLACRSSTSPSRTAYCTAPVPGSLGPAGSYRLVIANESGLASRVSIYVS